MQFYTSLNADISGTRADIKKKSTVFFLVSCIFISKNKNFSFHVHFNFSDPHPDKLAYFLLYEKLIIHVSIPKTSKLSFLAQYFQSYSTLKVVSFFLRHPVVFGISAIYSPAACCYVTRIYEIRL